jgi:hypothetical protein
MQKNYKKYFFSGILLLMVLLNIYGQKTKVTGDLRLATEVEAEKSFAKNWKIGVGAKTWMEKNISEFGEIDLEGAVDYRPFKFLEAEVGYRWSKNKNKYGNYNTYNRFGGSLDLIKRIEKFRFDYRICYQNIDDENFGNNEDNPSKKILRNRIQVKYNIRKYRLTPFLLAEHYGQLYSNNDYGIKIKAEIGTSFSFNKHHEIEFYFRTDRELNNNYPYLLNSLGLGYRYDF